MNRELKLRKQGSREVLWYGPEKHLAAWVLIQPEESWSGFYTVDDGEERVVSGWELRLWAEGSLLEAKSLVGRWRS